MASTDPPPSSMPTYASSDEVTDSDDDLPPLEYGPVPPPVPNGRPTTGAGGAGAGAAADWTSDESDNNEEPRKLVSA